MIKHRADETYRGMTDRTILHGRDVIKRFAGGNHIVMTGCAIGIEHNATFNMIIRATGKRTRCMTTIATIFSDRERHVSSRRLR